MAICQELFIRIGMLFQKCLANILVDVPALSLAKNKDKNFNLIFSSQISQFL